MILRRLLPAVLGVLLAAALVSWVVVARLDAPVGQRLVDLAVYRDAGRSVLDGRDVYAHLTAPPQLLSFTYPPFAALLAVPLAVVPFAVAGWLWTAGELALTAVIVWWGFRRLLPRAGRWWPVAVGALTGVATQLLPFRDEIKFGQVDEIVAVLCLLDCLVQRPRWPRGLLIGLATAIKLTPAVFIPYLWFTGRRRAATVAAATFVAVGLLTAAAVPDDSSSYWTDDLFHTGRLQPNAGTSNQSLRGMLLRAHLPHPAFLVVLLLAIVVVAGIGYRQAVAASRGGDELAGVALTGLLAVLLSPVAWIHHLVWLPLVVGVIVDDARSRRRIAWAVATTGFFIVKVPWIGRHMLHTAWPQPLARVVEDGYGLAVVALLLAVGGRGVVTPTGLAKPVEPGHDEGYDASSRAAERVSAVRPDDRHPNHASRGRP